MTFKFINSYVLLVACLIALSLQAPLGLSDPTGSRAKTFSVPSVPYPSFRPLPAVSAYPGSRPAYPDAGRFALAPAPVWDRTYGYAGSGYASPYVADVDDAVSTAATDGDDLGDEQSLTSDFSVQQKGRNDIAFLEAMYDTSTPNDFVNSALLIELINNFEYQIIPTKVRLVLLWQYFLDDFIKNDGWNLGDSFKQRVFKNTDDLTEKLKIDGWRVDDEAKTRQLPVGVTGVSFQGKKVSASHAVFTFYNDMLYEAFTTDKLGLDAFFNIWRSYTNLNSMTSEYLDQAINVLQTEVLPGRSYSLVAFVLVDSLLKDLQDVIERKARSEDDGTLEAEEVNVQENSIVAQSVEDLQQKLDQLSGIRDQLLEVVSASGVTPFKDQEILTSVKEIDTLLGTLEKGLQDFSINKQFGVGSYCLLVAKFEELLFRAGAILMSKPALTSWAKDILKRTLSLIGRCIKTGDQIQGANGVAAAFFAAYNLVIYIECLSVSNSPLGMLLSDSKVLCDLLKKTYLEWSKLVAAKPPVMAEDFVNKNSIMIDVFDKKLSDYDDKLAVLLSCFPYVSAGMKSDAPKYSSDALRKVIQKGFGVRIYSDLLKDEDSRYSLNISGFLNEHPWFKEFSSFDSTQFRLVPVISSKALDDAVTKKADEFSFQGIDEKTVDAFADDLKKNLEVWIANIDFNNKLIGADPTWMTFVTFGVVVSWLKTLATLDDVRLLSRGPDFKLAVSNYWGEKLVFLEKVLTDSRELKLNEFLDADEARFVQVISQGCAQYVVQLLKMISETKIIDVLELERKALASELYKASSLRSKDDPRFGFDVRKADLASLVGRIEAALNSADVSYLVSGIETLKALFDKNRAIVADDLLSSVESGNKILLIELLCAVDYQDKVIALLQKIPSKDFELFPVQVLSAWNGFLDVLFARQDLAFFVQLKKETSLTMRTGPKDLAKAHAKIKAYLTGANALGPVKAEPLPINIRSMDDFKIKNTERNSRFAAIFRDKDLKKRVVDMELILAGHVRNPFVFGFDSRFIKSPQNKKVTDENRDYQIGTYIGKDSKKRKAQASQDRSIEPLIILRSLLMLLESDDFKRGPFGYALAEHLLVPVYYLSVRYISDISNNMTLLSRMFGAVVSVLKSRLLDQNSMLAHASFALSKCLSARTVRPADHDKKPADPTLAVVKAEFDVNFPDYAEKLSAKAPAINPIPAATSTDITPVPEMALAFYSPQDVLVG